MRTLRLPLHLENAAKSTGLSGCYVSMLNKSDDKFPANLAGTRDAQTV